MLIESNYTHVRCSSNISLLVLTENWMRKPISCNLGWPCTLYRSRHLHVIVLFLVIILGSLLQNLDCLGCYEQFSVVVDFAIIIRFFFIFIIIFSFLNILKFTLIGASSGINLISVIIVGNFYFFFLLIANFFSHILVLINGRFI